MDNESVTANLDSWIASCTNTKDDKFFRRFRNDKAFLDVVEGTPETGGIWNLKRLKRNETFMRALSLIEQSDHVGSPRRSIAFDDHSLSPTTIRYANNAVNCLNFFGASIFSGNVYEIGAGYGGDCKVFQDFASVLGTNINWTIFDLPSSYTVIRRYLEQFGYSTKIETIEKLSFHGPALVMSNGAISEMRGSLLQRYIDRVVAPAQYGYFITNFDTHSKPYGGWSTDEFMSALGKLDKHPRELHTESYLSYFDKQAGSRLIVFGTDVTYRSNVYNFSDVLKILAVQKAYGVIRRLTNVFLGSRFFGF